MIELLKCFINRGLKGIIRDRLKEIDEAIDYIARIPTHDRNDALNIKIAVNCMSIIALVDVDTPYELEILVKYNYEETSVYHIRPELKHLLEYMDRCELWDLHLKRMAYLCAMRMMVAVTSSRVSQGVKLEDFVSSIKQAVSE